MMATVFEDTRIRGLVLPSRFVRSATWEGLAAPDASATRELAELYGRLARSGVGLVISGHAFVDPAGRLQALQLGAHDDALIPSLGWLADAVHGAGGKLALQLSHAGLLAPGDEGKGAHGGGFGPSVLRTEGGPVGREMTLEQISAVPPAFARAALRARRAGCDAVQIHAAHGYLLSSFLSPFFNRREDAYGGDLPNRARLVAEVVGAVRDAVGPDYPVLIKMNSEDFLPGGLTVDDLPARAAVVEHAGIDAVEVSGGTSLSGDYRSVRAGAALRAKKGAYYAEAARSLKASSSLPVVVTGGIRALAEAERLVAGGVADCVGLSRPLICEPDLIARWRSGDTGPSRCRSCNECFHRGFRGEGVVCVRAGGLIGRPGSGLH
jgi:2,4-dienoyl-CoA reductase-like NADH-dependent reductase (Old Yellow Enzyme family)